MIRREAVPIEFTEYEFGKWLWERVGLNAILCTYCGKPIDIMAAGGEHVIPPEMVRRIGLGDLKRGHQILDEFVKEVRKRNIRDLKKLPGPVKDGTK